MTELSAPWSCFKCFKCLSACLENFEVVESIFCKKHPAHRHSFTVQRDSFNQIPDHNEPSILLPNLQVSANICHCSSLSPSYFCSAQEFPGAIKRQCSADIGVTAKDPLNTGLAFYLLYSYAVLSACCDTKSRYHLLQSQL